jgi:hypothetical protein
MVDIKSGMRKVFPCFRSSRPENNQKDEGKGGAAAEVLQIEKKRADEEKRLQDRRQEQKLIERELSR